jgi:hypothetical protein
MFMLEGQLSTSKWKDDGFWSGIEKFSTESTPY